MTPFSSSLLVWIKTSKKKVNEQFLKNLSWKIKYILWNVTGNMKHSNYYKFLYSKKKKDNNEWIQWDKTNEEMKINKTT